ncbi:ABC transporter substrate-binding protein [Agromyces mangrovi Wang et al. 2018]|uniref:ABC transporter substrate-binding protein n=1 Tax=Agromyces mangrovi TaxID=1858653 RepID=UPI002573914C|nr:extracellular solute-binding protein [Agromyces mangrovi]BDZ65287.1 ABC transporter substrate-binding protein [Agromyces mangrovi]
MSRITKRATAAIAVAAVAGLALAGCSTDTSSEGADGEVVLTMSGWADDGIAEALIAQFEEDNPGVTIDYTGLPWPNILTQINTELVSGTASDIVVVFPGNGNPITAQTLAKGNYLADLSDSPWVSNYNEANQAVMGADGTILMGANAFTIIPAIYNTQALEAVGATPPTTWSEVLDLCKTATDNGKVAYALAAVAGGNYHTVPYALTATLLYGPDPDFVPDQYAGDATFSDSDWNAALDQYTELIDAGCFTADATGTALDIAQGQVAKGDALGMITVSPQISTIQDMAPDGATFETAAFPSTDDPADTFLPVGLGAGYGVNAKSENLDLAKKFVDFYLSEAGLRIAVDNGSIYPSGPVDGYTPPETLAGVSDQVQSDKTVSFPDQTWPNAVVNDAYTTGLQTFIGGSTTAATLLQQMDAAWNG